ncbi:MAG: VWA domain-containing protein [Alphaproteobacteria bacterium]|nr:VWA domain-containing protein [Alphaproteobacteria bacterium]
MMGRIIGLAFIIALAVSPVAAEEPQISIPKSVEAGANFAVGFESGLEKGDEVTIGTAAGEPIAQAPRAYPTTDSPSVEIAAPVDPGDYTVVIIRGSKPIATRPITVTGASASLRAPAKAVLREQIAVEYEGPANPGDHVTFVKLDGTPILYAQRAYPNGKQKGTLEMIAPEKPGRYKVAYFTGVKPLASVPLEVTGASASVSAPKLVRIRDRFEVTVEGPANPGDVLTLGDAKGSPINFSAKVPLRGKQSDKLSMTAPQHEGRYTVVYLSGSTVLASAPLKAYAAEATLDVQGPVMTESDFRIIWSGPENAGDRIGLRKPGGPLFGDLAHADVARSFGDAVLLRAPAEPGSYEAVYVTGGTELAVLQLDVQPPSATLYAPDAVQGGLDFAVVWEGPGNQADRVELVKQGSDRPVAHTFATRGNPIAIWAPREGGDYTLRYVMRGGKVLAEKPMRIRPPAENPGTLVVGDAGYRRFGTGTAVEILLDLSGGPSDVAAVKETLQKLVEHALPREANLALRVFGHGGPESCRSDLAIPIAPVNPQAASAKLGALEAGGSGKAAIAASLRKVAEDLAEKRGERIVLLVTDGEEGCGDNPAAALRFLAEQGVDTPFAIIGYGVEDAERRYLLESWAGIGAGAYFHAPDRAALAEALLRAMRTPFEVVDAKGGIVARGRGGEGAIPLPEGQYLVKYRIEGLAKDAEAAIAAGNTTAVPLQ